VHGTSLPPEFCPHAKTLQDGKEHVAEVHEDRLGGDFLVSTTPLRDEKGTVIGSVHVARNITDRKKAEEKLADLKEFDERIIDSLDDALLVIDPDDYKIISTNEVALKQLKLRKEELIGKTCYETTHQSLTPCNSPEHICPIRKVLETKEIITVEHTF
jgi:PAS domain-containing protein